MFHKKRATFKLCMTVYIVNLILHSLCVEWNCHYFFLFICRILACSCFVVYVLPYYTVNKDEY